MRRLRFAVGCVLFITVLVAVGQAQGPILGIEDYGWANTNIQSTPPAALVMGTGVCVGCSIDQMSVLNALTFYPSTHIQTVTITAAWGSSFNAFASAFAAGGDVSYEVAQILSNDGLVPTDYFTNSQGSGGSFQNLKPLTVTSVKVVIAPFKFEQVSGGWWVAVGNNGGPPAMNVEIYGSY